MPRALLLMTAFSAIRNVGPNIVISLPASLVRCVLLTPQSLDVWHLSQKFSTLPTLSAQFIEDKPPIDRVIAVPSEPQFIFDSYVNLRCARPMPVYSVPGLVDHF